MTSKLRWSPSALAISAISGDEGGKERERG
jgi:hypothetical protein